MSSQHLRTAFRPPPKCSQLLSFASFPDSRAAPEVPLGPPVQRVELSVAAVPRDGAVVAHGTDSGIIVVTTAPFAGCDHQRRLVVTLNTTNITKVVHQHSWEASRHENTAR